MPETHRFELGYRRRLRYLRATMVVSPRSRRLFQLFGLGLFGVTSTASLVARASTEEPTEREESATTDSSAVDDSTDERPSRPTRRKPSAAGERDTSHAGQFSLRMAAVGGFHIVMRYDESPLCAETEPDGEPKKFCGFSSPVGIDTAIGYAPLAGVEPFFWGRFGLAEESKTNTKPLLVLGAGVRLYTMSDAPFKFFIEPAVGAELESGTSSASSNYEYQQDFLVRLTIGPQYDFNRYFGLYVAGSMSMGFMRSLNAYMELHGGVQGRLP